MLKKIISITACILAISLAFENLINSSLASERTQSSTSQSSEPSRPKTKKFTVVTVFLPYENSGAAGRVFLKLQQDLANSIPQKDSQLISLPSRGRSHPREFLEEISSHSPDVVVFLNDEDYLVFSKELSKRVPDVHVITPSLNKPANELVEIKNQTIVDSTPDFKNIFSALSPMLPLRRIALLSGPETINALGLLKEAGKYHGATVDLLGPYSTWQDYKDATKNITKERYDLVFMGTPFGLLIDNFSPTTVFQFKKLVAEMRVPTMGWMFSFGRTFEITVQDSVIGTILAELVADKFAGKLLPKIIGSTRSENFRINASSALLNGLQVPEELYPFINKTSFCELEAGGIL